MYNEKLENISKTDKELIENFNLNISDIFEKKDNEIIEFLLNELDKTKNLINDPLFLEFYLKTNPFSLGSKDSSIGFDIKRNSFFIYRNGKYYNSSKRIYLNNFVAYKNFIETKDITRIKEIFINDYEIIKIYLETLKISYLNFIDF